MGIIDEVKQRTDIVEIIGEYASLTKAGRTFRGLCPFHSEKHPSFFVYPEQQSWHCFGACNSGGDVFSFIMKKQNIDFGEALRLLAQRGGITIPSRFEPEAKKEERERLYQVNQAAVQYFHNLLLNSPVGEKAREYFTSRGFSPKTVTDFQLGFSLNSWDALRQYLMERGYTESELLTAGLIIEAEAGGTHDRFRNRLMFPIADIRGRIVGFGARVLDDSLPKYINSPVTPIFDKSGSLYGINLAAAAIRQRNLVVLVEGYIDTITAHQNGFNNVVASMGTAVTEKQVGALIKQTRTKNIVLALDADTAGEEAMLRGVGYENTLETEVKVMVLPKGKDPDDVIKENTETWSQLLADARAIMYYTFTMVTADLDMTKEENQILAASKLLKIIADTKDSVRLDRYLRKLENVTGITYRKLEEALSKIKQESKAKRPRQEVITRTVRSLLSSPIEEYCLTLLLQHPELKASDQGLSTEYFENSENREIFTAWQRVDTLPSLKDRLDGAIWEYLDSLIAKSLPNNQIEQRYNNCVLRLQEKFLRSLEAKKAEVLALEAKSGGTAAELAKLEEQGIEVSVQLGKVFTQKIQRQSGTKR